MDERLENIMRRLPDMTTTLGAQEFDDIVDKVIDEACDAAEIAVFGAEAALLAAQALGRRAFTEHSPVLTDVKSRQLLVEDV